MKSYSAILFSTVSAYGMNGGGRQGYGSPAMGSTHGYGYNIGGGYKHGDSHGQEMGQPEWLVQSAHDHIIGYDSVQPEFDELWDAAAITAMGTLSTDIQAKLTQLDQVRAQYIADRKNLRIRRLDEIHEDNLVLVDAPFTLQLDLLEQELEDIAKAKAMASADATEVLTDLTARMLEYRGDRERDMNLEAARVMRVLDRAVTDNKDVTEVLYAMRLDWLQGLYVSGDVAGLNTDVYDMSVFDSEFDLFSYDAGSGKGHGHTGQGNVGPRTNAGFVVGTNEGGQGGRSVNQLRGAPGAVDGKTRRYDRQTLSGGRNDYGRGVASGRKQGSFGYDQAAQEQVGRARRRRGGRRTRGGRRSAGYGKKTRGAQGTQRPVYR